MAAVNIYAAWVIWLTRLRLLGGRVAHARPSPSLVSLSCVILGAAGVLFGAWLIGRWCLGLAVMAEAGWLAWLGLNRDDGQPVPVRGARTVAQVFEDERLRP